MTRKYLVVSQSVKEELAISDDITVEEVRGLVRAILGVEDGLSIRLTCCGKQMLDSMGLWKDAMGPVLSISREGEMLKVYCFVSPATQEVGITAEAVRYGGNRPMNNVEQQQLVEQMAPMADAIANNPALLRHMLESMGLNPDHAQVKELQNNKELIKRMVMASVDPDAKRSLVQESTLQLAQIEATQDGSYMLNSMMTKMAGDSGMFLKKPKAEMDVHDASEESCRPDPSGISAKEALPDPWSTPLVPPSAPAIPFQANPLHRFAPQPSRPPAVVSRVPVLPAANARAQEVAPPAKPVVNPRELYADQLSQLQSFGFDDIDLCIEALQASHGDIGGAIDYIDSKGP